jgi:hypothetical protein
MKLIFLSIFISFNIYAKSVSPVRGLYYCKHGNEESICDQILKPTIVDNELTAIQVEYVGWCGSMGPYEYYCANNVCENPGLKFEFIDEKHYNWENKQYGFHCEFEKK